MRTLRELIQNNSIVWIYCENKEQQIHFLTQAENEGFLALNGQKSSELYCQRLYGISDNMTMGYLSSMCWSLTFREGDNHVRVNYGKYIAGEVDYMYHKPESK